MMGSGIYKITNRISGRVYVGSAVQFKRRWHLHQSQLRRGKHHSRALQSSWKKHGPEAFEFEILEEVPDLALLIHREQFWMDLLDACSPSKGFNASPTAGSPLGCRHTPESKAKMSAARKGEKKPPFTDAHRAALSAAAKRRFESADARAELSAKLTGGKKTFTEETKNKIRAANRLRNKTPEMRAKVSAALGKLRGTPEAREKQRQFANKRWEKNRAAGIVGGHAHSAETKLKLSVAKKGKMSDAHRAAIALSNKRRAEVKRGSTEEAVQIVLYLR